MPVVGAGLLRVRTQSESGRLQAGRPPLRPLSDGCRDRAVEVASAFAALHDPASRTYYDRCRARGNTHAQTLLRLARHRISVLFATLRDGTFYEPRTPRLA